MTKMKAVTMSTMPILRGRVGSHSGTSPEIRKPTNSLRKSSRPEMTARRSKLSDKRRKLRNRTSGK